MDGNKKVKVFNLSDMTEVVAYEKIMNAEECKIIKEIQAYDRFGNSVVTVWWVEDSF